MSGLRICVMLVLVSLPWCVGAIQVAGIEVAEQVQVDGVDQPLLLNGAGVRKKYFISVYVGALYLPQRQVGVGDLLSTPPANRVLMHFVYSEVDKRRLDESWREGFRNNSSGNAYAALEGRLSEFLGFFRSMREGDIVWLDYAPAIGTRVTVNNEVKGVIEGADFNAALLAVWLGREPVTEALKNAMLGVDKD